VIDAIGDPVLIDRIRAARAALLEELEIVELIYR
jgi:hypothetical protein